MASLRDQIKAIIDFRTPNPSSDFFALTDANQLATAESSAGVTPTNFTYAALPADPRRYGADPTGVADSRTAFNSASTVNQTIQVYPGTYLINSNVTIAPSLIFNPGAILKPALGVTITLSKMFTAGVHQIFDLSLGGVVALPTEGCCEVWAEWWGAKGDNTKTNNEVPFNQAWYALAQSVGGTNGGRINFDRGVFLTSGTVYISDNITIRGHNQFYTYFLANPGTWNSNFTSAVQGQSAQPLQFNAAPGAAAVSATLATPWSLPNGSYTVIFFNQNGAACDIRGVTLTNSATTATWAGGLAAAATVNAMVLTTFSIFNARIENLRIHVNAVAAITSGIYAPAWQQKSGTDNVHIYGVTKYGIHLDNGYGGAAQLTLHETEIVMDPSITANSYGIFMEMPGLTVGWLTVCLDQIQVSMQYATVTFTGALVGATSATLTANWPYPTGAWNVIFSDQSSRLVTLTNGATTATWAGAVTATAVANAISPNGSGTVANGRVIYVAKDVHFEQIQNGVLLQGASHLIGCSLKADGGPTVQTLLQCSGTWTGAVNITGMMRGGAVNYIQDNSRGPYALANAPGVAGFPGGAGGSSYSDQTIWPPDPRIPVGAALAPGGAANAALTYQTGTFFSGGVNAQVHTAVGVYTFTMATSMDAIASYNVIACSDQGQLKVQKTAATTFVISTFTPAGVAADSGPISIQVYHSP